MQRYLVIPSVVLALLAAAQAAAEDISFPADAGVVDVRSYGALGDDEADDTAALQAALDAHPSGNTVFWFPDGTYRISAMLNLAGSGGNAAKRNILQGQSRDGAVIRLQDRCPGFQDPSEVRALLRMGDDPAQRFRNAVRNLTFHTGSGNPGVAGVMFYASNQGTMRRVRIVSGDGAGDAGLHIGYASEIGPALIRDLEVVGFDYGVKAYCLNSITMENIRVQGQRVAGVANYDHVMSLRNLVSVNSVPAVQNTGVLTLLSAGCTGGDGDAAITNSGVLYARDLTASGYDRVIDNTGGSGQGATQSPVAEFTSHAPQSLFDAPARSLHLPIRDAPEVPWDPPSTWTDPADFGAKADGSTDDTAAVQAAIDSGATTIYVPRERRYRIDGTLHVRGAVRRLIGCETGFGGSGTIVIGDGDAPVVVFERMDMLYQDVRIRVEADRTVVISSCTFHLDLTAAGSGDLFCDDVCVGHWNFTDPRQHIWCRQINPEANDSVNIVNAGATLWIMGLKTERGQVKIETGSGGATELLGASIYSTSSSTQKPLLFRVTDASASFAGVKEINFGTPAYENYVEETRGPTTRRLSVADNGGRAICLFTGYATGGDAPPTVAEPAAVDPDPVTGSATGVSVLGADDGGEAALTYRWSAAGPAAVSFAAGDTTTAKTTTATFTRPGSYLLTVTIRDAGDRAVDSSVPVTVQQTPSGVRITP